MPKTFCLAADSFDVGPSAWQRSCQVKFCNPPCCLYECPHRFTLPLDQRLGHGCCWKGSVRGGKIKVDAAQGAVVLSTRPSIRSHRQALA
jgi:hypothetical protein